MNTASLKYFTDPAILCCIGARRLGKLLRPFATELQAINFPMPPPDEPDGNDYFHGLAAALARAEGLPLSVRSALLTLETAASPENQFVVEEVIKRRLPNVSLSPDCVLDRALEVWLVAPEELARFSAAVGLASSGLASSSSDAPSDLSDLSDLSGPQRATCSVEPSTSSPSPTAPPAACTPENKSDLGHIASDCGWSSTQPRSDIAEAAAILDSLVGTVKRFAVFPRWVPEVVSLFVFHTYAWELREITTYLGIESPQHRCGKSTLLAILRRLVNRPEGAAHISGPATFRTIQKGKPTLLVDETEKVLKKNQLLNGILNASYSRELAYVVRVIPRSRKHAGKNGHAVPQYIPSEAFKSCSASALESQNSEDDVARFSCWCPKAMAQIGHFPETLADRCIIITMQRKTPAEKCERVRNLKEAEAAELRRRCTEFVQEHREEIANAEPAIPEGLNDRAADIWEPLFVLADLAGGDWPQKARQAALALSGGEQTNNLISSLLLDCLLLFVENQAERMFTRDLVQKLNALPARPWRELAKGKPIDDLWLARQLRPFDIHPTTIWIGQQAARGYLHEHFIQPARRYNSKADWEAYQETYLQVEPPDAAAAQPGVTPPSQSAP